MAISDSISRILLREAARKRGLEVSYIGTDKFLMKLTHPDGRWELFRGTTPMKTSVHGRSICLNKDLADAFVRSLGIATPPMQVYDEPEQAEGFLRRHRHIVAKPADASQSQGVTTNITTPELLRKAIKHALPYSQRRQVVLQKQVEGNLYRLLVLNGKLVAAAHRKAAEVVGDGNSTVEQLIEKLNKQPGRGVGPDKHLKPVDLLAAQRYLGTKRFKSIPSSGLILRVTQLESVSVGGQASNVTHLIHPELAHTAEMISKELRLFICGFDIMCQDVSQLTRKDYIPMLEMNSMPGLKIHHFPTGGGEPIDVAGMMLDALFPPRPKKWARLLNKWKNDVKIRDSFSGSLVK